MITLSCCATIEPFERQFLNDRDMKMGIDSGVEFNNYVHSIREGSVPAASMKTSGGCGCN